MTAASPGIGLLDALVLGVVEGLTEFLPISSTGHLILARSLLGLPDDQASHVFVVGIQMGAISAILLLYRQRLLAALRTIASPRSGGPNLLWQIAIAAMPAIGLGLLAETWIDAHLFGTGVVISTMLLGGVVLLLLEQWLGSRPRPGAELTAMSYRTALAIGLWQCLALVPGTSRSAATIGGALALGLSRPAAAEFSFLVGLPILYGASLWKLVKHGDDLRGPLLAPFAVATLVAFLSALCVVRPFVTFLRTHTFAPFAWYRIGAGIVLALAWFGGWLA